MKRLLLLLALTAAPLAAQEPGSRADEIIPRVVMPNGNALLQAVRNRLPQETLTIEATLKTTVSSRSGPSQVTRVKGLTVLEFGRTPPRGAYTIFDPEGVPVEKVEVEWSEGNTRFRYYEGRTLEPRAEFDPAQTLKATPFTWHDLSLSFLWWPNAETAAQDTMTLRKVWLVDVEAPAHLKKQYSRVRLYVDQAETLVRKAEVFNAEGERIREIEMKGLQDIDGLYMFKDLKITSWPGKVRTMIIVEDLTRGRKVVIPDVKPIP